MQLFMFSSTTVLLKSPLLMSFSLLEQSSFMISLQRLFPVSSDSFSDPVLVNFVSETHKFPKALAVFNHAVAV